MGEGQTFDNSDLRKATRMVDADPVFAFACYEGKAQGDTWEGQKVGNTPDPALARRWLKGEDVDLPPPIVWGNSDA